MLTNTGQKLTTVTVLQQVIGSSGAFRCFFEENKVSVACCANARKTLSGHTDSALLGAVYDSSGLQEACKHTQPRATT